MIFDILKKHWLFNVLDEVQLKALSKEFLIETYSTGQYIFHESDPAKHLFVILEGEVSIETNSATGKVIKISHLSTADIFGELALIDHGVRSAGALATKTTTIAVLTKAIFRDIVEKNPSFCQKLLIVLADRLRKSNNQVEALVSLSLLQRTAKILLDIQRREGGDKLEITQSQLSERLFASREKVNVKLKTLEKLNAISIQRGSIRILNIDILDSLARPGW